MNLLVNIDVDNLEHAVQFYTSAFDLKVARRFGTDGVELLGGSSPIYLLSKAAGTGATPGSTQVRDYDRHWTPVHLDVVVEDVEESIRRATAAGATQEGPIQVGSWGKLVLMADPFGHGFCLVQFVGRGYDAIATPADD